MNSASHTISRWWLVVHDRQIAINDTVPFLPCSTVAPVPGRQIPLGDFKERPAVLVIAENETDCPSGYHWDTPRTLMQNADEASFRLAGKATQLAWFYATHQYCGHCGHTLIASKKDIGQVCPQCSLVVYPQISPCIIVAVRHHDKILLTASPRHRGNFYTVIAGFVEAGETLEETVHREVWEETGIYIKNLRYISSQPWPFPSNLMMAYLADYDHGEIVIEQEELSDAQWFTADTLPDLAPEGTVARHLINMTLDDMAQVAKA